MLATDEHGQAPIKAEGNESKILGKSYMFKAGHNID